MFTILAQVASYLLVTLQLARSLLLWFQFCLHFLFLSMQSLMSQLVTKVVKP